MPPLRRPLPMPVARVVDGSVSGNMNMSGSPLERVVIQALIPDRRSSLLHNSPVRAPSNANRRRRSPTAAAAAGPSRTRSHARTRSNRSDSQPILATAPGTAVPVEETPTAAAADSPRTLGSARRSLEAVQPREILDSQSTWSGTRAHRLTSDSVVWPFFSRTESTSSVGVAAAVARPRETASAAAVAAANESPVRSTDSNFVRVQITGSFEPSLPQPPPPAATASAASAAAELQRGRGRGRRIPREVMNRVQRRSPEDGN
ncbi:hypothetical protein K445DRAFT_313123 [Daldinia sp. EC12]|nr:hypothetical protein K445DRAFT_313123 [Daldinia sp. EC12]